MKIHDLSGFLPTVHLFGSTIPVYFVVTALAFIVSLFVLVSRADRKALSRTRAIDTSLVLMVTGFIGSRLFHVFFEEPAYYEASPWRVLDFWSGGFVWYGGAVTGAICAIGFLKLKREPLGPWLDLFAPVGALGYAVGRMACVLTGCCYGRVFLLGGEVYRHPTQTYAVVWELAVLALLLWIERRKLLRKPGSLFLVWLALHAGGRIVMELFRDDPRGPAIGGLSVSTVISLTLLFAIAGVSAIRRKFPSARL